MIFIIGFKHIVIVRAHFVSIPMVADLYLICICGYGFHLAMMSEVC